MVSVGQEFGDWLNWVVWLRVSHEVALRYLPGFVVIWELDWGLRIHSQPGSVTWMANWCWLLARCLSSSPQGPQNVVAGFPQNKHLKDKEQATVPCMTWPRKFYTVASVVFSCSPRTVLIQCEKLHKVKDIRNQKSSGLSGSLANILLISCMWNKSLPQSHVFKNLSHFQYPDQSPSFLWNLPWPVNN